MTAAAEAGNTQRAQTLSATVLAAYINSRNPSNNPSNNKNHHYYTHLKIQKLIDFTQLAQDNSQLGEVQNLEPKQSASRI